ncbi:MAG: hypothetical protein ACP6IY_18370 [Promethearchaeia archaeon]
MLKKSNIYQIKKRIIEYLKSNGCALQSQLKNYLGLEDSRYMVVPLKELLNENIITKVLYRRAIFYTIIGNEQEVKRKVRLLKMYIIEIIKKFGPIRSQNLAKKIKEYYDYNASNIMIYRLSKELVQDKKIFAKKLGFTNIYYIDKNQEQGVKKFLNEIYSIKKNKILKKELLNLINEIIERYNLNLDEREKIQELVNSLDNISYSKIKCMGRSNQNLLLMSLLILTKVKIFEFSKKDFVFEELNSWLRLNEILSEEVKKISNNSKIFFMREFFKILNIKDSQIIAEIYNSPNYELKIKYLLKKFKFNNNLEKEILNIALSILDKMQGKDIKNVIGGIIYFICKYRNFKITQKNIAEILKTSEVSIRKRYKELESSLFFLI